MTLDRVLLSQIDKFLAVYRETGRFLNKEILAHKLYASLMKAISLYRSRHPTTPEEVISAVDRVLPIVERALDVYFGTR